MSEASGIAAAPRAASKPPLELSASRQFPSWLAEQQISLAFTTYQAGKLFLLGRQPDNRLGIFERTFNRCMGLWSNGQTLWMSSQFQLWRFENALQPGESQSGFDRLYVPRIGYTTGDIDVHDVAVDADGRVVFINTLFSCLATTSDRLSFQPLWQPPFISKLAAEDRCHLNGLAMEDGKPRVSVSVQRSRHAVRFAHSVVATRVVSRISMRASVLTPMYFGVSPRRAAVKERPRAVGAGLRAQEIAI